MTAAAFLASTALTLSIGMATTSRAGEYAGPPYGVLYVEANSTIPGQNAVLGYRRAADGSLTPLPGSPFLTGGTGWFDPTYSVGPFDGDGIMAADRIHHVLFVPNGGSKTIAALKVHSDGSLTPIAGSPFAVAGNTPDALALHDSNLVIVDNGQDPLQAGIGAAGYETATLNDADQISLVPGGAVAWPASAVPTQALSVYGTPLVLTNEFAAARVTSYFLGNNGKLHFISQLAPPWEHGEPAQPHPIGLATNPAAPYVYVGLPNVGRVAVYRWNGETDGSLSFVRTVGVSGVAPCWIHVSPTGKLIYVVNTVTDSVSVLDAADPSSPHEVQHFLLRGATGFSSQIAASPDGKFFYTMEEESSAADAGHSNQLHVLKVDSVTGLLSEISASPVKLPVPAGNRPQGILMF